MPTIDVTTNIIEPDVRRTIASVGTTAFTQLGLVPEHVSTRFTYLDPNDIYVGETTFAERFGQTEFFVIVKVAMGSKRGDDVRVALAEAYTTAVSGVVARTNVSVDFIDREASDAFVGGTAMGRDANSDPAEPPSAVPVREVLDGRLRRLLSKRWKIDNTDWRAHTQLAELRPVGSLWDSLEVAQLIVFLESNLRVTVPEAGDERVKAAFGDEATYGTLLEFIEATAE